MPQLKKFADDDSIKAIIIHVNSPGGGVAASEEIYREVKRIRDEKKKRIVASIETVGASGAYYVSSATNKIYADKGSVVGSIGVIAEWVNYGELLRWAKLKHDHHEGRRIQGHGHPDARNDARGTRLYAGTDRQHAYASSSRRWPTGGMRRWTTSSAIADGKVWTGEQALRMKLMDQIADFEGCGERYGQGGGISGEPMLVQPEKRPQDSAGPAVWRCFRVAAQPGEAAGAAGRVLLSVEVEGQFPGSQFSVLRAERGALLRTVR